MYVHTQKCVTCTTADKKFNANNDGSACGKAAKCGPGQYYKHVDGAPNAKDDDCKPCPAGTWKATTTDYTACAKHKACNSGTEYQKKAGLPVANPVCAALATCKSDQYISKAHSKTSNRVCSNLTPACASKSHWESVAPSKTSDRVCTPVTTCNYKTHFQSKAPTHTNDRVCTPLALCTSAQYQTKEPTTTSDRQCADLTASATALQRIPSPPKPHAHHHLLP